MADEPVQPAIQYLDFDIEIGKGDGFQYPVSAHALGGDASEQLVLPFDSNELERYLEKLTMALLASATAHQQLSPEELEVRQFGEKLFQALFTPGVLGVYNTSLALAQTQGKGLRIRLNILADDLSRLPWEFLFDPVKKTYLCRSKYTPVVRYLNSPQMLQPMEVKLPLQILGMLSSPSGLRTLDVAREKANLEQALQPLTQQGLARLTWLKDGAWRALFDAMNGGPWHIFHFIGHGGYNTQTGEGILAFEGADKQAQHFTAGELSELLADHPSLRLAVLNACESARSGSGDVFSSTAASLVRRSLPAAIAMQQPISDAAAIELSQLFYQELAAGQPVDAALSRARLGLSFAIKNTLEWGTPVLFMRTDDGVLFKLSSPSEAVKKAEQPVRPPPKIEAGGTRSPRIQTGPVSAPTSQPVAVSGGEKKWQLRLAPDVTLTLLRIPAGNFLMGSRQERDANACPEEMPQHLVYLPDYYLVKTPVTVAQFAVCMKTKPFLTTAEQEGRGWVWDAGKKTWVEVKGADWRHPHGPGSGVERKANHPVTQVSWRDALAFCQWLGQVTQLNARLPSEAEWEKAARGSDGLLYPWGNDPPDGSHCNYGLNVGDTTPVGSYSPLGDSPYGCQDMAGNVWEWTRSLWGAEAEVLEFQYPYRAGDGREDERSAGYRVLRGGAYGNGPAHLRCAFRGKNFWTNYNESLGFRVVVLLG